MRIIQKFFKNIEQKSKLDLITELLIFDNSTEEAFDLYRKVKANFELEMKQRNSIIEKEIALIRTLKMEKIYNPDFDKPLSEIETNFEIVNPN